jgi:[protein-PII] uridylyltransferase
MLADGFLDCDDAVIEVPVAMELLRAVAETGHRPTATMLERLPAVFDRPPPARWDGHTLEAFTGILRAPHSTLALELGDNVGAWPTLIPEWRAVRGRVQHDPYHRYTVDAHCFQTVAEISRASSDDRVAASAIEELGKRRTLHVAALLHDCGKGTGEDHTVSGERLARSICERMGLDHAETDEVAELVRRHLLLVDTATRRDLDDGAVIERVANTVEDPDRLRLLYVISVADGRATGPDAWNEWKATLVQDLYTKAMTAVQSGVVPARHDLDAKARQVEAYEPSLAGRVHDLLGTLPPSYPESTEVADMAEELLMLANRPSLGEVRYRVDDAAGAERSLVTVCAPDRPGTLARTAGVLALNRIAVLSARAYSSDDGLALQRFVVSAQSARWKSFETNLQDAYAGRLELQSRIEQKTRDYHSASNVQSDVRVLADASSHSTVVEVRAPDVLGLLYAITSAIADLDLDIHVAKVDTLGARVVDVFYVRTAWGDPLDDLQVAEVRRSVAHRISRLGG